MQEKTLLPQIAAPVQRPQIANSSVQDDNQAAVQLLMLA
jgi:hypothetical protein